MTMLSPRTINTNINGSDISLARSFDIPHSNIKSGSDSDTLGRRTSIYTQLCNTSPGYFIIADTVYLHSKTFFCFGLGMPPAIYYLVKNCEYSMRVY